MIRTGLALSLTSHLPKTLYEATAALGFFFLSSSYAFLYLAALRGTSSGSRSCTSAKRAVKGGV